MRQIDIPFGRPILDSEEIEAVKKVLESPILAHGPVCAEFEKTFAELIGCLLYTSPSPRD